jgi:predicted amidohydrolase
VLGQVGIGSYGELVSDFGTRVPGSVLVAGCQVPDIQDDPAAALRIVREVTVEAVARGAQVVCFPEAFLTGYTRDDATAQYRAVCLSSPGFRSIHRKLSGLGATVVVGLIERDGADVFNTAVVLVPGQAIGVYRKRHLVDECFVPGQTLPIFTSGPIVCGVGICSDARAAEDAGVLAQKGVDVMLYPLNNMLPRATADRWRDEHARILRQRARQMGAWVVSADVIGGSHDHAGYGCTAAIHPTGAVLDQVDQQAPGVAWARIPVPPAKPAHSSPLSQSEVAKAGVRHAGSRGVIPR